jgi:hypothetical protein
MPSRPCFPSGAGGVTAAPCGEAASFIKRLIFENAVTLVWGAMAFCDRSCRKWPKKHAKFKNEKYFQYVTIYQLKNHIFRQLIAF